MKAADLKDRLRPHLRSILLEFFPRGRIDGHVFKMGDIHGAPGDSLQVELEGDRAGLWQDFATSDSGDIIKLWAIAKGIDVKTGFREVLADIERWLGIGHIIERGKKTQAPPTDDLGAHTHKWDYTDAAGKLIACVYRYDPPGGKQYRPWDVGRRKWGAPEPRPLYNQSGIARSQTVVLCEGEKSADALIASGICATTAMGGAKAPLEKTDWSPLQGKHVTVWPDHDEPGMEYARRVAQRLGGIAASLRMLTPDPAWPVKYDAADAVADKRDIPAILQRAQIVEKKAYSHAPLLTDWQASRYAGDAPEQKFLVEGVFPLSVVSLLAAMGDTGKGMLTLNLALQVATGRPGIVSSECFGGRVLAYGQAVIFTAEDDQDEVHRRLARLDPEQVYLQYAERLMVIPLPNACGPLPLVTVGAEGPAATPAFHEIREQLLMLPDLRLVVFDPLASFIHADVTSDPAAGSFATGLLASLATETRAAVIIAHHMRKPQGGKPICTAQQARDAIRGTSALVDGVRAAYALWPVPPEEQHAVFRALHEKSQPNALFQGAVVKANGPADRTVRTYWRGDSGLLVDVSGKLSEQKLPKHELLTELREALERSARNGHPFCHTGGSGVFRQRHRLPPIFRGVSRHRLEVMVQELLDSQKLIKGRAKGSTEEKWLDIPEGPFARGDGVLEEGAEEIHEG